MKRLLPLLMLLLFLTPALAEDDPTALFLTAHPGYEITASEACGNTAAAILTHEAKKVLCIAERVNGTWAFTIDNPNALLNHEARDYHLFMDTDNAVYWYCEPWDTREWYGATKVNGVWQMASPIFTTNWSTDFSDSREVVLSWGDGKLTRTQHLIDENDNIVSTTELMPLPASWLDGMTTLSDFDVNQLPTFQADIPTVMEGRALELAAKELLPDYAYVGGALLRDELHLLMDKPDGTRVFVGVLWDGEWKLTESTPLPKDTRYGNENFTDYLYIPGPDHITIHVTHWPDGTWGVNFLMPDSAMFTLGRNYLADSPIWWADTMLVGNLPWSDITTIDWSTLPQDIDEARAAIDNSGWAMVNNPNPEDRLHLRVSPDRSANSRGKYYNGTFVRVLERGDTWTRVDVFGIQGWMMTKYLAFGDDMEKVQRAFNPHTTKETLTAAALYEVPGGKQIGEFTGQALVLGLVGDEWYHVWLDDTEGSGYVRQEDLWAGNG